jgi:aldehyde dehydrogenase (NAD+)
MSIMLTPNVSLIRSQEEIFGPILPILTVKSRDEAVQLIRDLPGTPLCLYVFTKSPKVFEEISQKCPSGSAMRNDCLVHLCSGYFPFGGLGSSGYGSYHGDHTFETFSHQHLVMYRPCLPGADFFMARYHPFGNYKGVIVENLLRLPGIPVLHVRAWLVVATVVCGCRYVPALQNLVKLAMPAIAGLLENVASVLRQQAS